MAILLDQKWTRHAAINPLFRNSNTVGAYDKDKAGVTSMVRVTDTDVRTMIEGISSAGNNEDGYKQSTDRGMSFATPAGVTQPVVGNPWQAWENGEFCIYSLWFDRDGIPALGITRPLWVAIYHGGNNAAPRRIGLAYTDNLASGWTRYSGNPVMAASAFGTAQDDYYVADARVFKFGTGDYGMYYRGAKNAGSAGSPVVGVIQTFYATSSDLINWTKYSVNPVIGCGAAGSVDDQAACSVGGFRDSETGRIHLWYQSTGTNAAVANGGVGYAYSDDRVTFTKGANNPVYVGSGAATDWDKQVGDTLDGWRDSDVFFANCMGFNITNNAGVGGARFEGRVAGWHPIPATSPARGGMHYRLPQGQAAANKCYSSLPSATIKPLANTTWSMFIAFKCPKFDTVREFWCGDSAFNKMFYLRLTTAGLIESVFRIGSVLPTITGGSRLDDNKRRWVLWRRTASGTFDLYTGDETGSTLVGTYASTDPGTDAGATTQAFGNWNASSPTNPSVNEPTNGSLYDALYVQGGVITPADALAWFNSRTIPAPSGGTQYRWKIGGSNTTTDAEETGSGVNLTHAGTPLPTRVEITPQANLDISVPAVRRRRLPGAVRAGSRGF